MWISVFGCVDEGGGFEKGDHHTANHYTKLSVKADTYPHCGHCESHCPFGVRQEQRMEELSRHLNA